VVPSAPGKRNVADQKITDLLYLCHAHAAQGIPFEEVFQLICNRYLEIIKQKITSGATADYAASRGYLL
jgi:aspartate kinase